MVYLSVVVPALVCDKVILGLTTLVAEKETPALFAPIICHETVSPLFKGVLPATLYVPGQ
jgi:hypothetical protein